MKKMMSCDKMKLLRTKLSAFEQHSSIMLNCAAKFMLPLLLLFPFLKEVCVCLFKFLVSILEK